MASNSDNEYVFATPDEIAAHDANIERLRNRHLMLKLHTKRIRLWIRLIHLPVAFRHPSQLSNHSIANLVLMTLTLAKYRQTQDVSVQGQALWPPKDQTVVWPTIFAMVAAAISIATASAVLLAYLWSVKMSDRMDTYRTVIEVLVLVINLVLASVVGPTMFLSGNNSNSLWGVSCAANDAAVALYQEFLNLGSYCIEQVRIYVLDKLILEFGRLVGIYRNWFGIFGSVDLRDLVHKKKSEE